MFDTIKGAILRDMQTAEGQYADAPRDALIHHFLLLEACERLERLQKSFADLAITMQLLHDNKVAIESRDLSMVYCFSCKAWHHPSSPHKAARENQEAKPRNTGIMIAFFLDPETAQQLAIPGGEAPEDLHITLAFMGDMGEQPDDDLLRAHTSPFKIRDAIALVVKDAQPLTGVIGGLGRFTPAETDKDPIIALVDIPGLVEFRTKLTTTIEELGYFVATNHGYTPHITLSYIDHNAAMPVTSIPPLPFSFDTVWLCVGDERIPYPLGKLSDQTYSYKVEVVTDPENDTTETIRWPQHETHPTTTQSPESIADQPTRPDEEASTGAIPALHSENGTGDADRSADIEEAVAPVDATDAAATREFDVSGREAPDHFKAALVDIATKAIKGATPTGDMETGHLTDAIAQLYLEAQRYAYSKAMKTVGIPIMQEGIIGGIARGIKATFDQALSWAKQQVESIVSTLQEALSNFIGRLGDIEIDAQVEQFLEDYAAWKSEQIVNVAWGTGADLGTNEAIEDILEAATSPDAMPGFAIDNVRVKIEPAESSNDQCKEYAGNDYTLEEWSDIDVHFPFHPNCPHYAEIYMER